VLRPWGLLGKPIPPAALRDAPPPSEPKAKSLFLGAALLITLLALLPLASPAYALILLTDIFVFALFAASLHFLLGPAGLHSFGHAAYFGLGAYGAGILFLQAKLPMEVALALGPIAAAIGALLFGWFCVRLAGVYSAMLTLAFAQIVWSAAFQWNALTGGSNGLIGLWPAAWMASKPAYYLVALAACALGVLFFLQATLGRFGFALRAGRDSAQRAEASGIDVARFQWAAFAIAGAGAGLAGALYAFSKGSISPESLGIPRSVDGLVMVMLGGVQTLTGAVWGAALFTWLQDAAARGFEYWRAATGAIVLALLFVLPGGLGSLFSARGGSRA
jgi:branched-chain amino acid transport system permease protein